MRKVGSRTLGLFIIILGVILIANQYLPLSFQLMFSYVWAILVVGLIIECLFFYRSKEQGEVIRFNKLSISVLLVALVVSGAMQSSIQSVQGFSLLNWAGAGTTASIDEEYQLDDGIQSIRISAPNATVKMEGTNGDSISITGTVRADGDREKEALETYERERSTNISNNAFEYIIEKKATAWFSNSEIKSVNLVIQVPHEKMVDVDVTNGRVEISGISAKSVVSSTNGTVLLTDITGSIEATTTNGRITARNIDGAAEIQTTNGGIEIENASIEGDWDLQTTNGKIGVKLGRDSDFQFEGNTTNGSVDGDLNWEREKEGELTREKTQGTASHGSATYQINAKTTNGSISVSLTD